MPDVDPPKRMPRLPWQWVKLALARFADFKGRSSRPEFLWGAVGYMVSGYIVTRIAFLFSIDMTSLWLIVPSAAVAMPALAVLVRRLHDLGHSGWWPLPPLLMIGPVGILLADVPIMQTPSPIELMSFAIMLWLATLPVVMLLSLVWTLRQGDPGPNRYGQPPVS